MSEPAVSVTTEELPPPPHAAASSAAAIATAASPARGRRFAPAEVPVSTGATIHRSAAFPGAGSGIVVFGGGVGLSALPGFGWIGRRGALVFDG